MVKHLSVLVLMAVLKNLTEINICHYSVLSKYVKKIDRIKHFSSQKRNISDVYYHNHMKIRINADDDLFKGNILSIKNAIIFVGLIFNHKYNHYHHDMHLTRC